MADEKHPLDQVAEQLMKEEETPVAEQDASPDFWELHHAADETVGDYPQVVLPEEDEPEFDPEKGYEIDETNGLNPDGFPREPIARQIMQPSAKWTDVLSANLWSEGYLLNDKALAAFKQCELGESREYAVTVLDHDRQARTVPYLYLNNEVPAEHIDFGRSVFYVAGMLGEPLGATDVNSFDQWKEQLQLAVKGKLAGGKEFSSLRAKQLFFKPGHNPNVDLFRIERVGAATTYITKKLKDAIEGAGITGLEIRPNKRLFAD